MASGQSADWLISPFNDPIQPSASIMYLDRSPYHAPRSTTFTSLTVAGFKASGQSADWGINVQPTTSINQPLRTMIHFERPLRAQRFTSLTVAGFGFRTIGRLVTAPSINHPSRSPTSSTYIHQFDRGGLRLQDNRQTGRNNVDRPLQSTNATNHIDRSHCGSLWLWGQSAGLVNHQSSTSITPSTNYPLNHLITSNLQLLQSIIHI